MNTINIALAAALLQFSGVPTAGATTQPGDVFIRCVYEWDDVEGKNEEIFLIRGPMLLTYFENVYDYRPWADLDPSRCFVGSEEIRCEGRYINRLTGAYSQKGGAKGICSPDYDRSANRPKPKF